MAFFARLMSAVGGPRRFLRQMLKRGAMDAMRRTQFDLCEQQVVVAPGSQTAGRAHENSGA